MSTDPKKIDPLLARAADGDATAVDELFGLYRERLKRMVRIRLNQNLRRRVDDSDVLQDAYLEAVRRMPEYLEAPQVSFFLWLRQITRHKIIDVHRRHLGAEGRDARLEVTFKRQGSPLATSFSLADHLLGRFSTPSESVKKAEIREALQEALAQMEEIDREILSLRHFECLSNREAARELGIDTSAASKRYLRALKRLQKILKDLGLVEEIGSDD